MNIVSALFLVILIIGLFRPVGYLTWCVFIMPAFASVGVFPPEWTGGANITPVSVAALFFVIKGLSSVAVVRETWRAIHSPFQMGLLCLFLIIAIAGAYALPRLFSGEVTVFTMHKAIEEKLMPTMANFTQSAYLALSTLTALTTFVLFRNKEFITTLLGALIAGCYAVIVTGLLDWVTNVLGISDVLSAFRTADYAILSDVHILNSLRICGLTTEASAYGGLAASYFALLLFLRPSYPPRLLRLHVPILTAACGVMALLSLSSTAYVMMGATAVLYVFKKEYAITSNGDIARKSRTGKLFLIMVIGAIFVTMLMLSESISSSFMELLNTLIFKKNESLSYIDRMHSNDLAMNAFLVTNGIGVGVGSVRTSNFFINILASTGVLGSAVFMLFLMVVFFRRGPKGETRISVTIGGAKLALIVNFIGMALAATTPDFGVTIAILFGLILGFGRKVIIREKGYLNFRNTFDGLSME